MARLSDVSLKRKRGYLKQAKRREAESAAKRQAVEHARFVVVKGGKKKEAAEELGLSVRTLSQWVRRFEEDGIRAVRRGRPPRRSSAPDRNRVIHALELFGPQTGLGTLKWFYPDMARGELEDLLRRYREHEVRGKEITVSELDWLRPGAVWSMDHTDPPEPVDGNCEAVLSVQDVSSGAQLLWEGQAGPRAELVKTSLERLFLKHGPALVLKSDNGSAFIAEELQVLCRKWGVILLWSPPRKPRYNGSCESGIRWMKVRTENLAMLSGRPRNWRSMDLERALALTNELPKQPLRGAKGRGEVFAGREPLSEEEQAAFLTSVQEEEALEREARGVPLSLKLSRSEQATIDRTAIRRALVAQGILNIRKRRVALTLKSIFRAKIS